MKYGVIDIGSNSVRLMISNGEQTIFKLVKTTRLAEGMGCDFVLKREPIERTAHAVSMLSERAKQENVDSLYAFATAAVRQAINGLEFTNRVKDLCGLEVDVITGNEEANFGIIGALNGKNGGIIDVGGASTEIIVLIDKKIIYSKSIDFGVVKIKDACGQDYIKVKEFVEDKIIQFGQVPKTDFYGIGGTATSISAIIQQLDPYDPKKVHGHIISIQTMENLCERLFKLTEEQKRNLKGLQPERAGVIAGGCLTLLSIMKKIGIDKLIVSESDNLEGYLKFKLEKK